VSPEAEPTRRDRAYEWRMIASLGGWWVIGSVALCATGAGRGEGRFASLAGGTPTSPLLRWQLRGPGGGFVPQPHPLPEVGLG